MQTDYNDLLALTIRASLTAGQEIMKVYAAGFDVETKPDNSPITLADKNAHDAIVAALQTTGIPVLSEEGREIPYEERSQWEQFWMVDPLDGTKEFVKRSDDFSVNIALMQNNKPAFGVIYGPVNDVLYFGGASFGAYRLEKLSEHSGLDDATLLDACAKMPVFDRPAYTVLMSRSHPSPETLEYIEVLEKDHGKIELIKMGSSLKLCLIAEGTADIYPRFAPTKEWDTAAGHAILHGIGKTVIDHKTGSELLYNKKSLRNNWFLAK